MKCYFCDFESIGSCKFCGRGICTEDKREGPLMYDTDIYTTEDLVKQGYFIYPLWCGKCVSNEGFNLEVVSEEETEKEFTVCKQCNKTISIDEIYCSNCGSYVK